MPPARVNGTPLKHIAFPADIRVESRHVPGALEQRSYDKTLLDMQTTRSERVQRLACMKKILIVEDDPIIARIYKTRLEKEGYKIEFAADGQTGLDRVLASQPDAVLLDLMLPKINGMGVLKKIRAEARFKKTPIIVFTNAYLPSTINESFLAGATQVFNKATINPKEIIDALHKAIFSSSSVSPDGSWDGSKPLAAKSTGHSLELVTDAPFHSPPPRSRTEVPPSPPVEPEAVVEPAVPAAPAEEMEMDDAEFQADLLKSFIESTPQALVTLRKLVQDLGAAKDQAARLNLLLELYRKMHDALGTPARDLQLNISTFGAAVEVLLQELHETPKNLGPSTLRTIGQSIDLLADLCASGVASDPIDQTNFNIMVADDEILSRRAIIYALGKTGLKATSVEDPQAALKLAAGKSFDLILLDNQMPGLDGLDLCAKIHALPNNKNTPVILVTRPAAFKTRAKDISSGGADLISKPFMFMELTVKALTAVFRSHLLRETKVCSAAA